MSIREPKIKLSYVELLGFEMALKKFIKDSLQICWADSHFRSSSYKNFKATALSEVDYLIEDQLPPFVTGLAVHNLHILPLISDAKKITNFHS